MTSFQEKCVVTVFGHEIKLTVCFAIKKGNEKEEDKGHDQDKDGDEQEAVEGDNGSRDVNLEEGDEGDDEDMTPNEKEADEGDIDLIRTNV